MTAASGAAPGEADVLPDLVAQNLESAGHWSLYATHRAAIAAALDRARRQQSAQDPRLVVLGAGNCNDIDLDQLTSDFTDLHLVDLDTAALHRATDRYASPSISLVGDVDVSGIGRLGRGLASVTYETALKSAAPPPQALLGCADVVLSAGLYSQLVQLLLDRARENDSGLPRLVTLVRERHLAYLCAVLKPTGAGVLTIEVVSSDTLPELTVAREPGELTRLIDGALRAGNFFTGNHPAAVASSLERFRRAGMITRWEQLPPWKWTFDTRRQYAAMGFVFSREPLSA